MGYRFTHGVRRDDKTLEESSMNPYRLEIALAVYKRFLLNPKKVKNK
jgi:hypothetical protein